MLCCPGPGSGPGRQLFHRFCPLYSGFQRFRCAVPDLIRDHCSQDPLIGDLITHVCPVRIGTFNQLVLPGPSPSFQPSFLMHRVNRLLIDFEINKRFDVVFLCMAAANSCSVLLNPAAQVSRRTYVNRSSRLVGQNVDEIGHRSIVVSAQGRDGRESWSRIASCFLVSFFVQRRPGPDPGP